MVSTNSRCGNGGMVLSEEESEHLKKEIYDVAMGVQSGARTGSLQSLLKTSTGIQGSQASICFSLSKMSARTLLKYGR